MLNNKKTRVWLMIVCLCKVCKNKIYIEKGSRKETIIFKKVEVKIMTLDEK